MTGAESMAIPYTSHKLAPAICTSRRVKGLEKKYEATTTMVATHPIDSIDNSSLMINLLPPGRRPD